MKCPRTARTSSHSARTRHHQLERDRKREALRIPWIHTCPTHIVTITSIDSGHSFELSSFNYSTGIDDNVRNRSHIPMANTPPPEPRYPDYARMNVTDHVLGASSTVVTLLNDVSALIPHAGPLSQVLGITNQLIGIIGQIRDNKDACEFLVERILRFMKGLMEECARLKVPIGYGTPMEARLRDLYSQVTFPRLSLVVVSYRLSRKIEAIKSDAETWITLPRWKKVWSKDAIKTAVSRHEKNLEDCFRSFTVSGHSCCRR
jgi:hypothetical protein